MAAESKGGTRETSGTASAAHNTEYLAKPHGCLLK